MGETSISRLSFSTSVRSSRIIVGSFLVTMVGCGLVPRSRLDECHRVTQTLRADNHRLEDVAHDLRAQNQDLTQRAVDDARRIALQEEAVERLEKSVLGYQADRERITRELDVLSGQVREAAVARSVTLDSRPGADP
jgi:chemotaxis protein MotB